MLPGKSILYSHCLLWRCTLFGCCSLCTRLSLASCLRSIPSYLEFFRAIYSAACSYYHLATSSILVFLLSVFVIPLLAPVVFTFFVVLLWLSFAGAALYFIDVVQVPLVLMSVVTVLRHRIPGCAAAADALPKCSAFGAQEFLLRKKRSSHVPPRLARLVVPAAVFNARQVMHLERCRAWTALCVSGPYLGDQSVICSMKICIVITYQLLASLRLNSYYRIAPTSRELEHADWVSIGWSGEFSKLRNLKKHKTREV